MIKKIAFSAGAVATALSYQTFSAYIIFFYVDVMKLPVALAGGAMLIYAAWNAVNDPLAGYLSDVTRTRFGRRTPYLAAGAVPLGLLFFLLWVPPFSGVGQETALFAYFLGMICFFDAVYTITVINWTALFPEMFRGLEDRAQVNSYRQGFVLLGMLIGIALPPLLYNSLGWAAMGALFGLIIAAVMLAALWGSRENKQFSSSPSLPLRQAIRATFRNRAFLTFAAANLFVQYTFITILATLPFYAKYVLNLRPLEITEVLISAFLVALPMLFIWRRIATRIGLKKAFLAIAGVQIASLAAILLAGDLGAIIRAAFLVGAGFSGFILVSDIIMSDIIDEDETVTGVRREGIYFGIGAFVNRFAIVLQTATMGVVFLAAGYTPYVFAQSAGFRSGLQMLIALFPMIALLLASAIMVFYPLAGERLQAMQNRLAEMHKTKGAEV